MHINRADVIWNYAATFLKIAASTLLLPFILRLMPAETVGIWSVFVTINSLILLFDFGFNPSFTRNITYILNGIQKLQVRGFSHVDTHQMVEVDYGLLKAVLKSMQWFYFRVSIIFFLLLSTFGTLYIYTLLKNYHSSHIEVYIAWGLLCIINTFNLSSIYYDSLLQGKGLVKKSKQIIIISQVVYLLTAAVLIIAGKGLIAIVAAQGTSVIIVRWLSHRLFFTQDIKNKIAKAEVYSKNEIFKAIYPNAVKIGLTTLGAFIVQRSAIFIGSLYLPLKEIASYGISMQIIGLIAGMASIYTATYHPKIVLLRIKDDRKSIRKIYIKGLLIFIVTYVIAGLFLVLMGNHILNFIGSKTELLMPWMLFLALVLSLEQTNYLNAGNILSTKNEVPFFKSSLISGGVIILGLIISFHFFKSGSVAMLIVPIIVDTAYQAWKWPKELTKDLK
jgi:O-antigen/teichoic acid export membrane protein